MDNFLEQVMERYANMVYCQAYVMMGNQYDAEDIVQEVFYKYMLARPGFREENAEKAWFCRVTANRCRDLIRKRKRHQEVSLEEVKSEDEYGDMGQGLISVILSLPEKYREVIYLHYYAGYRVEEIARMLGTTANAVKKRLQRGRMLMKESLEGDSYEK